LPPSSTLLPYTTLFRSDDGLDRVLLASTDRTEASFRLGGGHTYTFTVTALDADGRPTVSSAPLTVRVDRAHAAISLAASNTVGRSEEHTSELQSPDHLV